MSRQTPPLDRRDLYKDRRYDRAAGISSDASRYSYPSRDYSRRAPSGYYRSYQEESGSRGSTPSRSDRFWYDEHSYRGYNSRYERGRTSNRDSRGGSYRRSPRYDPYHHHTDYPRRSPNYEPYHHQADYPRRSPNYEPYHHDPYPSDHSKYHHHHQTVLRSVAVPISSSSHLNSDDQTQRDYYKRPSSERRSDWERERERERERDRDRKRDDGPIRWSRREVAVEASESLGKRSQDEKNPEEDAPMKKARLGWGQGLAKYEKQKVGDPVEATKGVFSNMTPEKVVDSEREKDAIVVPEKEQEREKEQDSIGCEVKVGLEKDAVSSQALIGSQKDAISCQAPIGPAEDALACEVTPATAENEEKLCVVTENTECGEGEEALPLPNLDILDINSIFALASLLTNLLQPEDSHIGDLTLLRQGSLNKLSQLKEDISKNLEITETEIDSLETELKSLVPHSDNNIIITNDPSKPSLEEREININTSLAQNLSPEYDTTTLLNAQSNPNLIPEILASNLDASNKANSITNNGLFVSDPPKIEVLVSAIKSQNEKETLMKERIRAHKKEIEFKEMVLAHKFRAFRRLWKEELKLMPDKKNRAKSNGSCKNSIGRTRFFSPAGNLTPLASKKALEFTTKLMSSDSPSKLFRPHLKIPSLILSQTDKNHLKFISRNGLISDPVSYEKERTLINPWSQSEKETFIQMLCTFGKDFANISSFLPHKTTADCVEFYYKNHKWESFREAMKRHSVRKEPKILTGGNSNYLGTTTTGGKKRKREINSVSSEQLALPRNKSKNNLSSLSKKKRPDLPVLVKLKSNASDPPKRVNSSKKTKIVDLSTSHLKHKPSSSSPDLAKKANSSSPVGFSRTHSSEGVSSCITNSVYANETEKNFEDLEDEDACSDDGWREVESNHWSEEEKSLFVKGLALHGKDFVKISACVGSRSTDQCKVFFSKSWKCLSLDAGFSVNGIQNPGNGNPDCEIDGGKGSSSDEVCTAEIDSEKNAGDVKIFGRIIACPLNGKNGNNNNNDNDGILNVIKTDEIKDAIISVLSDGKNIASEGNVISVEGF